jgi:hypothetical protein
MLTRRSKVLPMLGEPQLDQGLIEALLRGHVHLLRVRQ